ncbi:hypothetical protein GMORB2_3926 [Geosmithia morbida]|uniref:Autophagy-related protein 14 n=1 Tax=Geosmithia morbida TaxID=1094350 RepID=A0A9P5D3L8_9HYPO|nr:uncharacterized protein GMORB2_3926 [Geosmithia morbida]KAF4125087.1 hypothetical protein GMORB2_3926 [Geosmithia morbida]
MECDICQRGHHPKRLPFLCAVDARNQAYEDRIKHLQVLIDNDDLRRRIQNMLSDKSEQQQQQQQPSSNNTNIISTTSASAADALERARGQQFMAEERTTRILEAADKLKSDIKSARDEVQARKADLARRRSDLASISSGLKERRAQQQRDVEVKIKITRFRWSQSAEEMASTRAFLCQEAAGLYGLSRTPRPGSKGKFEYQIGRVPVVNLMDMNSLSPELITTSLGHITRVVILASYYLSIRLPAEITSPHRDYPYPTILNLSSSYRYPNLPFPGTGPSASSPPSPSDPSARHLPKPRPLYIHKPLTQLLKDDPAAYSHFIEAVTLLAYDISWLCSSQGTTFSGKTSFEDICQIGRNLYNLLMMPFDANQPESQSKAETDEKDRHNPMWVGRYSHGTMFYFLGGAEGADLIRNFNLPSPTKLADKLKKKLVGDVPAPDWEVLDDDAWKIEDIPSEIIGQNQSTSAVATSKPREKKKSSSSQSTAKGSSRWTMVRL